MEEESSRPVRPMNFVSEEQLYEAKKIRGERVEDGTAQRDRPLYEILKENKDKKDAEFNERFKHRPPKALDEDETEFLDNLETSRREYERRLADEEAQELQSFQAAVAAKSAVMQEMKEMSHVSVVEEQKPVGRKNPPSRPLSMLIKVKPQAKKAKIDDGNDRETSGPAKLQACDVTEKSSEPVKFSNGAPNESHDVAKTGLVLYSDDDDDDDEFLSLFQR
ncbi:hypothetical protein K2173_004922 [Erythroxylum novogranatense]|uniref:FAM192A/Fyv6 N-terminal domain-containing protein n=1 Tax=Erythroxylum novogranatense TaxID=1862640 RepID=A0AAV8U8B8_9ROSI|nr:hypothetical protein K2173_004922 [Erythroxylum novogranatense]